MQWEAFIREAVYGGLHNVLIMASIIFFVMMIMEIGRDLQVLDRVTKWAAPALRLFGMSRQATFPLIVGLAFGIAYGAGVIIESARSGEISWRDLFLVNLFLSTCHAIFEDTALFLAVGANPWIILIGRFLLAVVLTYLVSRMGWLAAAAARAEQKN
ncbi:MAG: nucleoside recognition protein [Firmicutes bacterium]|nr:nucleoside recognition protein [Bacillota bacterium]